MNRSYFLRTDSRETIFAPTLTRLIPSVSSGRSRYGFVLLSSPKPVGAARFALAAGLIDEFNIHRQPWFHASLSPARGLVFQWKPGARDQIPDHLPDGGGGRGGEKSVFIE